VPRQIIILDRLLPVTFHVHAGAIALEADDEVDPAPIGHNPQTVPRKETIGWSEHRFGSTFLKRGDKPICSVTGERRGPQYAISMKPRALTLPMMRVEREQLESF
jgi:hypothetical protein